MSQVTIYCPPTGTTITGECSSTEVLTWNGNSVEFIQFFVPALDNTLIKFDLTNVINNGSDVELDLVYWVDGVYGVVQTWDLGVISTATSLYHFLDFGTNPGFNNYITLQFNITGGTTGQIDVTLDCDVDVVKELFCSGSTFSEACDCENEITLYADGNQTSLFPFQGSSWYLDASLQIEAPCGNYVPKKFDSSANLNTRFLNYYYNCITHLPEIYGYCNNVCEPISCSGGTSTYVHSASTYTFTNPLIETNQRNNSQTIDDEPFNFSNSNSFSKHCVTVEFPQGSNGIYSITIGYTGTSLPERYITFEDAAYYKTEDSPGQLSYNTLLPANSPWFIPMAEDYLIKFTGTTTYYIIPPKSGRVTVKFMIGSSNRPFTIPTSITTSITPSCESVPIYKYDAGLHVYSAYDSIISPRLTTTVYSLTPLASWVVNNTKIFNDNWFVQPAFPYWYSISGTTYKVGEPLRRDWGTIHQYQVRKKAFARAVNVNKISGPYQDQTITDLFSGQRTLPSCIHILGTLGILREKVPQINVIQPTKYKYFVGVSPFPNTTLLANKLASNDDYFTLIDTEFALSRDNCYPVTGFEHAVVKFGEAYSLMIPPYLDGFTGAREFYQNLSGYLQKNAIGRSNMIFGIAVSIAILVTVGEMSDPQAGFGRQNGGSGNDRYDQGQLRNFRRGGPNKCPKWARKVPGLNDALNWLFSNPKIALAILVVVAIATFIQWFIPINKIISECCKLLKVVNTNNPYIFIGDTIYLNQNMTTPFTSGWVCDGAYFYKVIDGAVQDKEVSFSYHGVQYQPGGGIALGTGPKTLSVLPDSPLYVTNITKLFFLPYVSGVPDGFTTNPTYTSNAISGTSFTDASVTGGLYSPLQNEYILEQGYFTSEISQEDADAKAQNFFNTVTAETQSMFGGLTYGPNIDFVTSVFSHEIKIEETPRQVELYFDNSDLSGLTIGKTVYLDLGFSEALTGYYSLSSDTAFRKFYLILSGQVQDVYTMETSGSTNVTSQLSGNTINISQSDTNFTSGWYKKSPQPIDNNLLPVQWNSQQFYSSDEIVRGFVFTPSSAVTFYTYSNNTGVASGYSEAESYYYYEILTNEEMFFYYSPRTLFINQVQICTLTGSGIDFQVVDVSGNSANAEFGIIFDAAIYTASTFDTSYTISIQSSETNKILELPFEYNGQITDVQITGYTSPNPVNKITYTAGTFTSCITPTSTPTQTPTVTPTNTITPTVTNTPTITPTFTPTSTTTITPSVTETPAVTPTVTHSVGVTPTPTLSQTPTNTVTPTNTITPSVSITPTRTVTPSVTPTNTITPSVSITPTSTITPSVTPTNTITPSVSITPTRTVTPSVTPTNTITPSVSITPTRTVTPSVTPTNTITPSVSITPSITATPSITPTRTVTPSVTPTNTITPSVSVTPTNSVTPSVTPTRTVTPSVTITSTITATPSITPTRTVTPSVSITPSSTITATPSVTPTLTPTVTPAGLQIQLSTPQNDECVSCRLTSYSTVGYVAPTDTTPSVNDIVYTNSTLTNVFNGASQWFKTSWSPNATQYSIQISASGVVLAVKDCSTCPSLTPTPTITATPTVTPSITASPSVTPSLTPTTTPAGASIQLSTPQNENCVACRLTTYSQTRYVNPTDTVPNTGDIVYQDSTLTTVFNGNSQWFKTTWGSPTEYSIQIATNGQVLNVTNCSTCPTQTPTPTPEVTQTPTLTTTPTQTPTNSMTPTNTPTNSPSPSSVVSYSFCLGYNASNCGLACTDYDNCNQNP